MKGKIVMKLKMKRIMKMKNRGLAFALVLSLACSFSGCASLTGKITGKDQTTPVIEEPPVQSDGKQVLLVYMVASNLESEAGMASEDISEMIESNYDEENLDVVICAGGASYWWNDDIDSDSCGVYSIQNKELVKEYELKNEDMSREDTLREFINYGYQNHEGDVYDLLMWDHGGGAIVGFGAYENYGYESLSMVEIDDALSGTKFYNDGNKFDWIGFDACLMGMLEVADVLSPYANYMIASEELEAGSGWNYLCLEYVADAYENGDSVPYIFIDAFADYYEYYSKYNMEYSLSCVDLSLTDDVKVAFEDLITVAQEDLTSGNYAQIAIQRGNTKDYGRIEETSFYDSVDLYHLASNMESLFPAESQALKAALDGFIVDSLTNLPNTNGIAVYFPYNNKEYAEEWLDAYEEIDFSDTYTEFLRTFTGALKGEPVVEWNDEAMVIQEDVTSGQYYAQLTQEMMDNYLNARYSIWQEQETLGDYVCWIFSRDVELTEDGKVVAPAYDGKVFTLKDDGGNESQLTAISVEYTDEYEMFMSTLVLNRFEGEDFYVESLEIYYKVMHDTKEIEIVQIAQLDITTEDTLFPEKQEVVLQDGDILDVVVFARQIQFLEDGSIGDFDNWGQVFYHSGSFTLSGNLRIELCDNVETGKICYMFDVRDSQGNNHYTKPYFVEVN